MMTDYATLSVFGVNLYVYGLIASGAFLVWAGITALLCRHRQGGYETALFLFHSLVFGFLGARLVYCVGSIPYYVLSMGDCSLMLRFWDGGYSLAGAMLGVGFSAALTGKVTKKSAWLFLDGAAVAAPLFVFCLRCAEHFTRLGYGRLVEGDWLPSFLSIVDPEWGEAVYAVYRMEAIWALALFGLMVWQLIASRKQRRKGDLACLFMVLYGAVQVLLESWRKDAHMVLHFVKLSQVLGLVFVLLAAIVWTKRHVEICGWNAVLRILWVLFFAMLGLGIFMEFKADRWENQLLVYGIFSMCIVYWLAFPLGLWHKLKKKVYAEDTIGVRIGEQDGTRAD